MPWWKNGPDSLFMTCWKKENHHCSSFTRLIPNNPHTTLTTKPSHRKISGDKVYKDYYRSNKWSTYFGLLVVQLLQYGTTVQTDFVVSGESRVVFHVLHGNSCCDYNPWPFSWPQFGTHQSILTIFIVNTYIYICSEQMHQKLSRYSTLPIIRVSQSRCITSPLRGNE